MDNKITEDIARLSAAAPHLLQALTSILCLVKLGAPTDPDHVDADFSAIAATARAAIAKATGVQS